jgi:thioredoxin-related protein
MSPATAPAAGPIRWHSLASGLEEAKRAGRPMLVDVVTDWCGWCRRMEKTTYAAASVRDYVERTFVAVKVDAEDDEARARYDGRVVTSREFADRFRVTGYPTTLFLSQDGKLITMVPGYVKPDRFLTVLRYIGDGHYRTQSFEAFAREADAPGR